MCNQRKVVQLKCNYAQLSPIHTMNNNYNDIYKL